MSARLFFIVFPVLALAACAAAPAPEANGYDVELYFDVGASLVVGKPQVVTVQRIELRTDQCASGDGSCDPTMNTPITLISASCASLCSVTPATTSGVVTLNLTANAPGNTTLQVTVRSDVDGSLWSDVYPLAFK